MVAHGGPLNHALLGRLRHVCRFQIIVGGIFRQDQRKACAFHHHLQDVARGLTVSARRILVRVTMLRLLANSLSDR